MIARLVTALFGPRCALGCGQRVYADDLGQHLAIEHAGDLYPPTGDPR